ncbi:apolipoprotein N-acyltransferase [Picosynechococcus sp. PCC 7117]|nr:apolipoprotein N-acyltransferase [Picosynechococcus sp. PCC 7117]
MFVRSSFRPIWALRFLVLGAGVLMGMASAPVEAWYLAWIALIPLWIYLGRSPQRTKSSPSAQGRKGLRAMRNFYQRYKQPLWLSFYWGLGYQGFTLFWITGIHPMTWMGVPWLWSLAIAILCWIIITLWGAGIPVLWALGMVCFEEFRASFGPLSFAGRLYRVVYGASLWCVIEYLWSQSDLFWHFLAFSQSPHNLAILQLAQLSGFTTISWLIVLVNGCLAEACFDATGTVRFHRCSGLLGGLTLILLGSAHLIGWSLLQTTPVTSDRPAQIGIIQGNIPNEIKLYQDGNQLAIANYRAGYETLAQQPLDLIITPETALPFRIEQILQATFWPRLIRTENVPLVLGAFGSEANNFTNSLFTLNRQGYVFSRYNKQRLVPLGEYIPFEAVLGKIINRLSPLDAHLVRGQNPAVMQTPLGPATVAICYESAYPEHFRRQTAAGGEFIIVASNDAHYSETMPAQHHALDVMQAIANGRWLVRANNTGHSGVIDPTGKTLWLSSLNEFVTYSAQIYLSDKKTPYVHWGNWLVKGQGLFLLGTGLSGYISYAHRARV